MIQIMAPSLDTCVLYSLLKHMQHTLNIWYRVLIWLPKCTWLGTVRHRILDYIGTTNFWFLFWSMFNMNLTLRLWNDIKKETFLCHLLKLTTWYCPDMLDDNNQNPLSTDILTMDDGSWAWKVIRCFNSVRWLTVQNGVLLPEQVYQRYKYVDFPAIRSVRLYFSILDYISTTKRWKWNACLK